MAKAYVLSESDLKEVKRLVAWWRGGGAGKSSRPVPTRRRQIAAGDGKAELIGAFAIIKGLVPAALGIDTSGDLIAGGIGKPVATPGRLSASHTESRFSAGALLVNPDGTAVVEESKIVVVDAINPSFTEFHGFGQGTPGGSLTEGILTPGTLADQDGVRSFIISWPDFRAGPGHDKVEAQAWYHDVAADNYQLGHGECAP